MDRTCLTVITCVLSAVACLPVEAAVSTLPGTRPLQWQEEDLSTRLMDGAHRFIDGQMQAARAKRVRFWNYDTSSKQAYEASVTDNRRRLRTIVGLVDSRLPAAMERFGDDTAPARVAEAVKYRVFQVRWPVLDGIFGEGLLVQPKGKPLAHVVVVPDADQTPEQILGLSPGIDPQQQYARRLAENGFQLVIPTLVSRSKLETDDAGLRRSDQTNREWIYRQAFHMGRHIIGYEVQKVLAAVDWFKTQNTSAPIGVVGYAEGGLIAFYAAALVSGYFDARENVWAEPIYRNVWSLLRRFGDAEIAALVLPRSLVVEYSAVPTVTGHKGDWRTPDFASVSQEFDRIPVAPKFPKPALVHDDGTPTEPGSLPALKTFAQALGVQTDMALSNEIPDERRRAFQPESRQERAVQQLERYLQRLVRESEHIRDRFFLYDVMPELAERRWSTKRRHETHSLDKFVKGAAAFRERFRAEAMGRFDEPLLAPDPRTRRILETDKWTAYDVVLDVFPELFAWGVLVVPKDLQPGQRRPVVVCQHGRNGLPCDTIDIGSTAYNDFTARLAERGFITFAPHNLYRGEDRYRWLDRKANTVKATLFSFIIAQHDQILRWLETLPFVDGEHIAFYGLSYGGETAVRVPPILQKYCLSICSGDFNQWTRKVAATDQPFTFMRTIEWEMPYWNLGHTFDYAEMTYLMIPRPFMVERGHHDLVGRDRWVAHEYAKVRWLYAQLGIADRTEIEFFQGGHSINGQRSFEFLHKHLDWPAPPQSRTSR